MQLEGESFYKRIAETKALDKVLTDQLIGLITRFKERFKATS